MLCSRAFKFKLIKNIEKLAKLSYIYTFGYKHRCTFLDASTAVMKSDDTFTNDCKSS